MKITNFLFFSKVCEKCGLMPIPIDACRLPNYKNVQAALTDLMCQGNGIAKVRNELQNLEIQCTLMP